MKEVARLYNIEDFKTEVFACLENTSLENEEIKEVLGTIINANKKLNNGMLEENYKLDQEITELKRKNNKLGKLIQSAIFILDGYGGEIIWIMHL